MKRVLVFLLLLAASSSAQDVTFSTVDVVIDTGRAPLGAYEIDLRFDDERVALVGVEAGRAFDEPPYYDPKALRGGHVVLAALDVDGAYTSGHVHVATLHVEHPTTVVPRLRATHLVVADADGRRVPAELLSHDTEDENR